MAGSVVYSEDKQKNNKTTLVMSGSDLSERRHSGRFEFDYYSFPVRIIHHEPTHADMFSDRGPQNSRGNLSSSPFGDQE